MNIEKAVEKGVRRNTIERWLKSKAKSEINKM